MRQERITTRPSVAAKARRERLRPPVEPLERCAGGRTDDSDELLERIDALLAAAPTC